MTLRNTNGETVTVKIAVCISVYNDIEIIDSLLKSIRYYTNSDFNDIGIIVIDDGSREEFKLGLRHLVSQHQDWCKNLYLQEHPTNLGISATWNHLWKFFNSEYTVILNNDIIVTKNWLNSLVYFLENNEHAGMCSLPSFYIPPTFVPALRDQQETFVVEIIDPNTRKPKKCQPHNYQERTDGHPGRVMAAAGCCFGVRTALLRQIGGFDEARFRSFYEEIDFGTACASRGYPSYALPYPSIYHVWGYTFNKNPELKAQDVMNLSRIHYQQKWGGSIEPNDPYNRHYLFMPKIKPYKIKWIDFSDGEEEYTTKEYQETWDDVQASSNWEHFQKLLSQHKLTLNDVTSTYRMETI